MILGDGGNLIFSREGQYLKVEDGHTNASRTFHLGVVGGIAHPGVGVHVYNEEGGHEDIPIRGTDSHGFIKAGIVVVAVVLATWIGIKLAGILLAALALLVMVGITALVVSASISMVRPLLKKMGVNLNQVFRGLDGDSRNVGMILRHVMHPR